MTCMRVRFGWLWFVAACWSTSPPVQSTPPATPPAQPLKIAAPAPGTCGADEVWEALCGGMGTGTGACGATADTNASWGYQRLVITVLTKGKADPALKRFVLDDAETQAYAASIPPSGAGLPGPFCCHTAFTPLVVAAR